MNRELLETQWVEAKEFLRDKWNKLTEEDVRQIDGRFDRLSDKLQQRYGYSSAQAEEEIRKWNIEKSTKSTYAADRPYVRQEERIERDDGANSILKWLLPLALALLLLGLYFGWEKNHEAEQTLRTNNPSEEIVVFTETPADQALAQSLRQTLASNSGLIQDLRNVRFTLNDGVLTVSGTVATAQERDRIAALLKRVNGIKQINSQIEVR